MKTFLEYLLENSDIDNLIAAVIENPFDDLTLKALGDAFEEEGKNVEARVMHDHDKIIFYALRYNQEHSEISRQDPEDIVLLSENNLNWESVIEKIKDFKGKPSQIVTRENASKCYWIRKSETDPLLGTYHETTYHISLTNGKDLPNIIAWMLFEITK